MNVNSYNTKAYENISNWILGENKPNSNPIKANLHFTAENAEYARLGEALRRSQAKRKDICVSDCPIKKYALYPISPRSRRTRRLMKNKAKQSQSFDFAQDRFFNYPCVFELAVYNLVLRNGNVGNFDGEYMKWQMHQKRMQ